MQSSALRTRWAAIGAAVAVTLGAGGVGLVAATSPAGAVAYVPIEPCRAADTRPAPDNVGPRNTPIGAAETHVVNSNHGGCAGDVPGTATGLQLNVTATGASAASFITIWASGPLPLASSLNPTPGQPPVPNAVTTSITGAGNFNIYNNVGSVNVIVDIVGYYTDHNHDDRYYTEAEVDAAVADVVTELFYSGVNTEASPTTASFELLRSVGSFTKQAAGTDIRLDWYAHHRYTGTDNSDFCHYQLRVDGLDDAGGTGLGLGTGGDVVAYTQNAPITTFSIFEGLSAGNHTVQIWVRGNATSCILNSGNFDQLVIVTESPTK